MEQGKGKYSRQVPLCAYQAETEKLLANNYFFLQRWCELRGESKEDVFPPAKPTVMKNGRSVVEPRGVNQPNVIFDWLFAAICGEFGTYTFNSTVLT